jgi:5-methylcytosine-specific restriction protein A
MSFVRGNLAIRDHLSIGEDLHLFEYVGRGKVRYIGQMVCTGFQERRGKDVEGKDRRVIVFELTPINAFETGVVSDDEKINEEMWQQPLNILRERAIASSTNVRSPSERRYFARYRGHAIRVYVLKRANGVCEACEKDAPFKTTSGRPYLEPHHIRRLSDGGPDHPEWVISLCPNCHQHAHHGVDKDEFNQKLKIIIKSIEKN